MGLQKAYVKHAITTAIYSKDPDSDSKIGPQKEIEVEVIEERETAYCVKLIQAPGKYRGVDCTQWVSKTLKTVIYYK
jgi:hypothetical protein